jgi:phospholipase C
VVTDDLTVKLEHEPSGDLPDDFVVGSRASVARLDEHACIAVIMMENRSYDHFFYDLPTAYPGRGYGRVPASYTNPAPPGFTDPMRPVRNRDIGLGSNLFFVPGDRSSDLNHNKEHTWFQIGGGTEETQGTGAMKGFAADFATKSDSPQIAMSYFGLDDLAVFKALADQYPVCDRWFAALPVGTYPNRLTMLQGNVPFLHNIKKDDPAIGYLPDYSIFDVLNSQGISWKMFESDIGTIRLYDRYRLDVKNVRPIDELDAALEAASGGGDLPRVMFIEPSFVFGNDDHPPMDVQQGQKFIRQVVGTFIKHGLLDKTLFVITYDEHGGFFDHVPPPGTTVFKSRPTTATNPNYGTLDSLFPQDPAAAPTCLGVRVPSMVLSKWASPRANHTFLDHTAILKTILLHNRASISTQQFSRFGERVKKRPHLGQVLDLSTPRVIDYAALSAAIGYEDAPISETAAAALVTAAYAQLTPEHPGNVLRGIGSPRPRRIVV